MASLNYNALLTYLSDAAFNPASASFYIMLVGDSYVPDKANHHYRSDVIAFEISGSSGYTAGGQAIPVTQTLVESASQMQWLFSSVVWNSASITARGAIIYNFRGGSPSADELVSFIDFGYDVTSSNGSFTVAVPQPLVFQN